jgi:hypothetical protein
MADTPVDEIMTGDPYDYVVLHGQIGQRRYAQAYLLRGSGLIWYSAPRATVGMVVEDGQVVDAAPYARSWAMGRTAQQIWEQGAAAGAQLRWLPRRRP